MKRTIVVLVVITGILASGYLRWTRSYSYRGTDTVQTETAPGTSAKTGDLTRSGQGNGVWVTVAPVKPISRDAGGEIDFAVSMVTHSGSLLDFNPAAAATLENAGGTVKGRFTWEEKQGNAHHRNGLLQFQASGPGGQALISKAAGWLQLNLKGLRGTNMRFKWEASDWSR